MAAYYKVDVSLSTNSVTVGMPSPQEVLVTLPLIGPAGAAGATGATGANGQGVPVGGTTGQVLRKASGTNYDTEWATGGSDVDLSSPDPIGDVTPNTGAFTTLSATGTATLPHIHGSLAGNLYIHVKNTSGGQLTRGTPVYIVGNVGDTDRVEVAAADFDDATKMPAVGLLEQTLANNGSGDAIILGELDEANTNSYTINTELFVGNNGALTSTRPTTGQVQSVGVVARVNSNTGVIVVNMQGQRSPNETFAAASHTHGNITNAGAIGTTSGLPIKTGTSGVLEAGAFGTSAGQFAEGNHTHAAADITSGVLDNARVNFAAPGAIGGTTAAAGSFTTLSATGIVTGSNATTSPPTTIDQAKGLQFSSLGGTFGSTAGIYGSHTGTSTLGIGIANNSAGILTQVAAFTSSGLAVTGGLAATTSLTLGTSGILSGGTNTVEQRNTTSGQTFRIYNTVSGTADANYERGFLRWNSNVLQIGTEKLGTGTARALEFQTDGTTRMAISTTGIVNISGTGNAAVAVTSTTGALDGAYFSAVGQKESFFNVFANGNASGSRIMRFGNTDSGTFIIQALNDSGTAVLRTPFSLTNTAPTNSFIIDGSGNVGIGGSAPAKLTVLGAFAVQGVTGVPSSGFGVEMGNTADLSYVGAYNRSSFVYRDMMLFGKDLIFESGGTQRMRILSTGNVGIGTAAPTANFHVVGTVLFDGAFTVADAKNIAVGTTTGTKIGTATTQKIGFFNATPVVQQAAVADATDAATVITQLNALLARMRTLGLIAT